VVSWAKFAVIAVLSLTAVVVPSAIPSFVPKFEQLAEWKAPPTVRVCNDAPVSKSEVEHALEFWRSLGYEFGTVIWDDKTGWCRGSTYFGSITIMANKQFLGEEILALTRRRTYNLIITGARIEISDKGIGKPLLLEHELGHALGWPHYKVEGHIMHPILQKSGIDTFGLQNT